jgi:hypothetical protein
MFQFVSHFWNSGVWQVLVVHNSAIHLQITAYTSDTRITLRCFKVNYTSWNVAGSNPDEVIGFFV